MRQTIRESKPVKTIVPVYVLGWSGMEKRDRTVYIPKDKVEVSDWFHPKLEGDLCINTKGEVDLLKKIVMVGGQGTWFKRHENYYFQNDENVSCDAYMVFVKKGQTFKFNGKTYTYKEHGYDAIIKTGRYD